jgi:hypothetical protein
MDIGPVRSCFHFKTHYSIMDEKAPPNGSCPDKDIQVGTVTVSDLDEGRLFLRQHNITNNDLEGFLADEVRNKASCARSTSSSCRSSQGHICCNI